MNFTYIQTSENAPEAKRIFWTLFYVYLTYKSTYRIKNIFKHYILCIYVIFK